MGEVVQLTIWDAMERGRWCGKHQRYGCHCGRPSMRDKVVATLEAVREEEAALKVTLFPLLPHQVAVFWVDDNIPDIATIRRHMAALAAEGTLCRYGVRGGYGLAA